MMYWNGGMGWWMLFGGLAFWGAIIGLIVWVVIRLTRGGENKTPNLPDQPGPLDIARERYAKGEISAAEFSEIQRNLK